MNIKHEIMVPADVPHKMRQTYLDNYNAITKNTGNLFLFVCDHKLEHLNADFYGPDIHPDAMNPEHIFTIATNGTIGALATHGGLIARYGLQYPTVNYIVKLTGTTNLIPASTDDPHSVPLYTVDDVIKLQQASGLPLRGIGMTLYVGSTHEHDMLQQAAQAVTQAHNHGLVALVWIYPRGAAITDDRAPELVAGAAGIGAVLGADFIKVKPPHNPEALRIASIAAGNTKIICSGGSMKSLEELCETLYANMHIGGAAGGAVGRSLFQCSQDEAIARTHALAALIYEQASVATALECYRKKITALTA